MMIQRGGAHTHTKLAYVAREMSVAMFSVQRNTTALAAMAVTHGVEAKDGY